MDIVGVFYIFTILSALTGLWITIQIFCEKRENKPMVCPLGASCETVVKSEFSTFLGVGLEIYGAIYYALIALIYTAILVILPYELPDMIKFIINGLSIGAFLFSIYNY